MWPGLVQETDVDVDVDVSKKKMVRIQIRISIPNFSLLNRLQVCLETFGKVYFAQNDNYSIVSVVYNCSSQRPHVLSFFTTIKRFDCSLDFFLGARAQSNPSRECASAMTRFRFSTFAKLFGRV